MLIIKILQCLQNHSNTYKTIPDIENDCGQYFGMYLSKKFKAFTYKSIVYTIGAS